MQVHVDAANHSSRLNDRVNAGEEVVITRQLDLSGRKGQEPETDPLEGPPGATAYWL